MSIDFEIPEEAKAIRERVRQFVADECRPAEQALADGRPYKEVLAELRAKARSQGRDIVDFGFGNPDLPSPDIAVEKLAVALKEEVANG